MHPTSVLIKERLATTRRDLHEVVAHLDQDLMDWAPGPGMRTVAGQLIEIAGSELQTTTKLKEGRWVPDEEVRQLVGDTSSMPRLQAFLESVRQETLDYVDSLTEEQLEAEVELKGWYEAMGLPSVPRAEALRSIAQHEYYHVGQLVSYLWAKGDDPYKW